MTKALSKHPSAFIILVSCKITWIYKVIQLPTRFKNDEKSQQQESGKQTGLKKKIIVEKTIT